MDTKSNQKTRRFTKLAWCEKWGKDSRKKLAAAAAKPGVMGKRARLAQTLKKLGK